MSVFICLVSLLVVSVPTCLHASMITHLQEKIYAVEKSLLQDIQILRATVKINTGEMQTFGKLVNATLSRLADINVPRSNDEVLKQGNITESRKAVEEKRAEQTFDEIKRIADDVERVKRAFNDEKIYLRTLENVLINKLDAIIQHQNKQNDHNAYVHNTLVNVDKEITEMTALFNRSLGGIMNETSAAATAAVAAATAAAAAEAAISSNITTTVSKSESSICRGDFSKLELTLDEIRNMTEDLRAKMLLRLINQDVIEVGSVRLVNTICIGYGTGGRLEVKRNHKWGTVCDDDFGTNNNGANVVCKMFGFSSGKPKSSAYFGKGTGLDILLDDVQCKGTESSIFDCPFSESHNCAHSEDVGVVCQDDSVTTRNVAFKLGFK